MDCFHLAPASMAKCFLPILGAVPISPRRLLCCRFFRSAVRLKKCQTLEFMIDKVYYLPHTSSKNYYDVI
jgi:hypothetical protein